MKWLFLLLLSPLCYSAEQHSGIQVNGSCEVKVVPDRGSVSFTTENQSKSQEAAVNKTNAQMNDLKVRIERLKLANLELKTTNYTVFPVREWEKEKYVDKGTKSQMTLEVSTSEIGRLSETMLEASKAGIQNVGSMMTFLSLEKSQAEYLKCLDVASEDARKKAQALGRKLGFKIGEVRSIIEAPKPVETPRPYEMAAMSKSMSDSAAPAPVEAGTQTFSTNIQVTFEIK